jgi:hypothetical protein
LSRVTARGPTADRVRPTASACVLFGFLLLANPALAQTPNTLSPAGALKPWAPNQLMDVELTRGSHRPDKPSTWR